MVEDEDIQRRHSHHDHFLHRMPASVISHLKTKVKRKRLLKTDSSASDGALNKNINENKNNNNNNDNNRRSNPDHTESVPLRKPTLTSASSHPILSLATSLEKPSFDEDDIKDNDENDAFIKQDEDDSIVPNVIYGNEDIEENAQGRTSPITSGINQKIPKSKVKSIKATKSLPETPNQSNSKKRRKTIRRTGFQIRDEDFSTIFNDLPSGEQLIIAFPCAWRKDVFMHGRMFLSANYFCFYTCFFKWEESLCIPYKDIVSVTREKSAKVVPNAVKIRTKNGEQYFFTSHISREKIFVAIFRLWQHTLLDKPLDHQQLRSLVYADQQRYAESSGDSEESITFENNGEDATESGIYTSQSLFVPSDRSIETSKRSVGISQRATSLPTDDGTRTYLTSCFCENHLAKTYADQLFTLNVDTLFEFLFCDNSFTRDFHNAQKFTDYVYGEWHLNKETGQRERQLTYKTITQSILGTNLLTCREKQILEVEKPHLIYVLSSEVYNEGMKYTDAFYVATRFCMTQRDAEHSSLKVTAEIKYIKNVNGIVKSFIEKNAHSSIEGGVNEQVRRLENHQIKQVNQKSSKKTKSISKQQSINNNISQEQIENNSLISSQSTISIKEKTITGKGIFYDIALFTGICLLFLHIYLCYKLYSINEIILTPDAICLNQCRKTCLENNIHTGGRNF